MRAARRQEIKRSTVRPRFARQRTVHASTLLADPAYAPITIHHITLTVPVGTIELAREFYEDVLGLRSIPQGRKEDRLWFQVGDGPIQIHIACEKPGAEINSGPFSWRHTCFAVASVEALEALRVRVWTHMRSGSKAAAMESDDPAVEIRKGAHGLPVIFLRDYASNWVEVVASSGR